MDTKENISIRQDIPISEIPVGSLDARYNNINLFKDSYMIFPNERIIDAILKGEKYYIAGNKGTGKTALMLYLSNQITEEDPNALCSTILFKTEYSPIQRYEIESFERKKIDTLDIRDTEVNSLVDFQNIWKLTIYLKIVSDNHNNGYIFFEKDTNWNAFEDLILRLSNTADVGIKERLSMRKTIPKHITVEKDLIGLSISEEQVNFQNATQIELSNFDKAIQIAEYLFSHLSRTDTKYYIFIDELETYCAAHCFMRDLHMIHDWIEVTWILNCQIKEANYRNMKIVLSVRSEVLAAIARNLCGDELNKKIGSYKISIDWRSKYDKGVNSPLFCIWLRKIINAYHFPKGINNLSIRRTWFPSLIGTDDTVEFILNRTWNKPRDIVRFTLNSKDIFYSFAYLLIFPQSLYFAGFEGFCFEGTFAYRLISAHKQAVKSSTLSSNSYAVSLAISALIPSIVTCVYRFMVIEISACPMMYCSAFGFMFLAAIREQNVCRNIWGAIWGSGSPSCVLLYFLTRLSSVAA